MYVYCVYRLIAKGCTASSDFHSLVYWADEDSVTVVAKSNIVSPAEVTVGCDVQIRHRGKICTGKVAAIGELLTCMCV